MTSQKKSVGDSMREPPTMTDADLRLPSTSAIAQMNAAYRAIREAENPLVNASTRCAHAANARWANHEAKPWTRICVYTEAAALLSAVPKKDRTATASAALLEYFKTHKTETNSTLKNNT